MKFNSGEAAMLAFVAPAPTMLALKKSRPNVTAPSPMPATSVM